MSKYPELVIDLNKLENNISQMKARCDKKKEELAGVIKGCSGIYEIALEFEKAGVSFIASSRLDQLKPLRKKGIKTPFMLIRIPMISEVDDVIDTVDVSLNSEIEVLKELNASAKKKGVIHKVILMQDLGDLREGFFGEEELLLAVSMVEEMDNLHLLGIGTNVGCYGSINATVDKLNELVAFAELVESKIGRKLEYISGGATSSLPRVIEGNIPSRINLLRVGEGILLAKDLKDLYHYDMSYMYQDVFTLRCEVIEVKDKPTHPIGEIMFDAFGHTPTYEDRGIRKRALLAIGKADYAFFDELLMREEGAFLVGASSDHTIVDVEDCSRDIKVGDIIEFDLCYATMIYVTNSNNINKVFIGKK